MICQVQGGSSQGSVPSCASSQSSWKANFGLAVGTCALLNKAMEMGYQIEKTYEIWHFEETSRICSNLCGQVLEIKAESSGDMTNEEAKRAYKEKYKDMGIDLELDKTKNLIKSRGQALSE